MPPEDVKPEALFLTFPGGFQRCTFMGRYFSYIAYNILYCS
ncbi:hypothetical protein HMPREF1548_06760 [Clostridium sp. KLE 1755]|nr:hypothetical protein HMPREF1548_06760 [Clostridium sp. KLE 1755]